MKIAIVLTALVAGIAFAHDHAGHPFAWLAGCWVSENGSAQEVWAIERGGTLVGFGAAVDDGSIGFYELLTIRQADDGSWVYTAHPSGQATTSFAATSSGDESAVFENAGHDYPQLIRYERSGDWLVATISLTDGSRAATFQKQMCPKE